MIIIGGDISGLVSCLASDEEQSSFLCVRELKFW